MNEGTPDVIIPQRIHKKANRGCLLLTGMVCIWIGSLLPKTDKELTASSGVPNTVNTDTSELECEIFMLEEKNDALNETIDTLKAERTILNMRIEALLEKSPTKWGKTSQPQAQENSFQPGGLLWWLDPEVLAWNLDEEVRPDGNFILDPKLRWEKPEEK